MQWASRIYDRFFPSAMKAVANQAAGLFEDRAWGMVERRIMWLTPRELRGYVRARLRPMITTVIATDTRTLEVASRHPQFLDALTDSLVRRLMARAEIAQSGRDLRAAA